MSRLRRRMMMKNPEKDTLYQLENGTFTCLNGSIVTISNGSHIYAKSASTGGSYTVWLYPACTGYYTNGNSLVIDSKQIYPNDVIFSLSAGDVVKFVIKNNNTGITNKWQSLYVGLGSGRTEKIKSGKFQTLTELITEVVIEEDVPVTSLFVHINRISTEAEFDLEVYVNDVRYF